MSRVSLFLALGGRQDPPGFKGTACTVLAMIFTHRPESDLVALNKTPGENVAVRGGGAVEGPRAPLRSLDLTAQPLHCETMAVARAANPPVH